MAAPAKDILESLLRGRTATTPILAALLLCGIVSAQPVSRDLTFKPQGSLPPEAKRWALVVGVNDYADAQISPLRGAANDAAEFAGAITRFAGFPADQVILLTTDQAPARQPTRSNILFHLSNLSSLVPKDGLFLFFFAGHGIEREKQAFLLPSDSRLTENLRILEATGIAFENLRSWVDDMNVSQVLMFLDACRNNPAAGRGSEPNLLTQTYVNELDFAQRNAGVEAFAVLYATAVGQRAYEYNTRRNGFFTWAIVEALHGAAADANGEVTLDSLVKYVQETVPKRVQVELGVERVQRPFAEIRGYRAGELVLAKLSQAERQQVTVNEVDPAAQKHEWEAVQNSRDVSVLMSFYKKHPDGPLAEDALQRIEQIEWEAARKADSLVELKRFYESRPHGRFSDQALARIRELETAERDRQGIEDALKSYMTAYRDKDAALLREVWPELSARDFGRVESFFKISESISLNLKAQGDPVVSDPLATVDCARELQFVDERGENRSHQDNVRVTLRRQGDGWVIDDVKVL